MNMINFFHLILIWLIHSLILVSAIYGLAKLFNVSKNCKIISISASILSLYSLTDHYIFPFININQYISDIIGVSLLFTAIYFLYEYCYKLSSIKGFIFFMLVLIISRTIESILKIFI